MPAIAFVVWVSDVTDGATAGRDRAEVARDRAVLVVAPGGGVDEVECRRAASR